MKAKIKKKSSRIMRVGLIFLILAALLMSSIAPINVLADDEQAQINANSDNDKLQKYHFPNPEIEQEAANEKMFSIKLNVLTNVMAVMGFMKGDRKTYIMVSSEPTTGHKSFSFNTPNIAAYIYNCLGRLAGGGWNGTMYDTQNLIDKRPQNVTTAKQKYTYDLPTPIYLGEYPYSLYDFNDLTSGFFGIGMAVKVAFYTTPLGWIVGGIRAAVGADETIDFKAKEIKTIVYNTLDYTDQNASTDQMNRFAPWIENNWERIKYSIANGWGNFFSALGGKGLIEINDKNIFEDDFIVPKGKSVGSGPDQMSGKEVLNKIVEKAGDSTPGVLTALVSAGTGLLGGACDPPYDYVLRYMPYDLDVMSKASQEYMNFVSDPRVLTFKRHSGPLGLIGLTLTELGHSMNCSWLLQPTKGLCETADNLNSICDLKFFSDNNVDLFFGWKGDLGQLIMIMLALLAIVVIIKGVIDFLRNKGGRNGQGSVIARTLIVVFLLALCIGLLVNPEKTSEGVTNVSSSIMSIGSAVIDMNDEFKELHTSDASRAEVSSLRYWATYFNIWSSYSINTTLNTKANKFDPGEGGNEYNYGYDSSPATLDNGHHINLWNAAMLEELTTNDFFNANRTIDHFMAPKITPTGGATFTTTDNTNWNGKFPFTVAPFAGIFIAWAIFLVTLMKFLCFIEFAIDLMLLFIRVITGAFQGKARVKEQFKDLGEDFVRIFAYEVLITVIVFLSFVNNGGSEILLAIIVFGTVCGLIWWLLMSPNGTKSILRPALFKIFHNIIKKVTSIAKKGIADAKTAVKAASGNYAGAAKEAKKRLDMEKEGEGGGKGAAKDKANAKDKKMDDGSEGKDRQSNASDKSKVSQVKNAASNVKSKAVAAKNKAVSAGRKVKSGANTAKKAVNKAKNIKIPGIKR